VEQPLETITPGEKPRVSVIIPAYNTALLIANCLDSVFSQTFHDFEVIVVNDGSPDTAQLEEVLRPYREKIVYVLQQNKRAAGARNTAIHKARGEFLAFLDSDDSWLPDHLASQMELFVKDPGLDMVYADALLISDAPRQKSFMEKCPSEGPASFEALVVERCQIPVSTVVVRKAAIVKAGLFDESLARCDDYDMWLRTAFFRAKMTYCRKVQARLFLGRPDSLGQSRTKMTEAYWRILEKAAQTLPLSGEQRKLVCHRTTEIRARHLLEEGKLQLLQRHPEKARELFAEANLHLRMLKIRIAIWGLQLAPQSASKLIAVWNRLRSARTV
jgi:glycosyltransferase involved in cell wall biosynthesis